MRLSPTNYLVPQGSTLVTEDALRARPQQYLLFRDRSSLMSDSGIIGTADYIAEGWVDPSINFENDISGKQLCVFWVSPIGEPSNATNWRSFNDVELYAVSKEVYECVKSTMERLDAVYDKAYDKAVSISEAGEDWYEFTFDYNNQEFVCNTNTALRFPIKPILKSV